MIIELKSLTQPAIYAAIQVPGRFTYDRIILHHTADVVDANKDGLFAEEVDLIHRGGHRAGYPSFTFGLGYHFLISPDGSVEVADRWLRQLHGAHTKGHNYHALGICMVGNFNKTLPTNGQLDSLEKILAAVRPERLYPHRHFSATDCPGTNIDKGYWDENIKPLSPWRG